MDGVKRQTAIYLLFWSGYDALIEPLVGIFAPASPVPKIELSLNLEYLASQGVEIVVHPQCSKTDSFFAGTDRERAEAFLDLAYSPAVSILYGARGGYGSSRILRFLEAAERKRGRPLKKKLIGYSDMTILNAFVTDRWGWECIHAPMPSLNRLENLKNQPKQELLAVLRGESAGPQTNQKLQHLSGKFRPLNGRLQGGNLSILCSMLGTPYWKAFPRNTILFLEDVSEALYRIDRLIMQLVQSGQLKNVSALVLGTFQDCLDKSPQVLADRTGKTLRPLRKIMTQSVGIRSIAQNFTQLTGIPVYAGLNVGHGMEKGIGQDLLWFDKIYSLKKGPRLVAAGQS